MAEFVDYINALLGQENGWDIEYKPVWDVEGKISGWRPKAAVYARGGMAEVVFADVNANYEIKVDEEGTEPVEKHGLYDSCIDNHMDIPESISKDSPCYKQFMKEFEGK